MIHERVRAWSGFAVVRVGALGVAAVLVLGGCSGDGEPGAEAAEASSSASPSSGATASASAPSSPTQAPTLAAYKPASAEGPAENVPLPVMPELAKQESKEGLEAFARHWYALINYGYETGEAGPVKAVSGESCNICANYYPQLETAFVDDDWMGGGQVETRSVKSDFVVTPEGRYQVLIQISQQSMDFYSPGEYLGTREISSLDLGVQMIEATYRDGEWFADDVVKIQ
ncbi:hypothetical protein KKR91_04295 [Arthrobacter jiangjiafuii]|uniref:DUF6318 domain-containing protein n=1 Tax=Arthrobacter jiangjiafuii TaxID=2817475 RepID=A0A975M6F6_9MICC|nr:DUF6318 family protein [Arthrobacter jiangjiafuii]MBP3043826.1 hypothetical protein [Arthrobacter jiangjiafuii]QWC10843.1 hypothetical protein KKR91_04295 [Arthrobacter jiangjiafuii]